MGCGITKTCCRPIFFTETVNAARYRQIVQLFIASLEPQERFWWFQEGDPTAHTVTETIAFLCEFFGDRLISHLNWPRRSPNLTPPDFFLWRYVEDKIFHNPPNTIDKLKLRITEAINAVEPQTLRKVFRSMQKTV